MLLMTPTYTELVNQLSTAQETIRQMNMGVGVLGIVIVCLYALWVIEGYQTMRYRKWLSVTNQIGKFEEYEDKRKRS